MLNLFYSNATIAQEEVLRSGMLSSNENLIGITTGMDYSILPLTLSYQRGIDVNLKHPIRLGAEFTVPMFDFDLLDFRFKVLSEATILRKNNFEIRGGMNLTLVHTKMQTESMTSIGADFDLFVGFTNDKWNVGLKARYNQVVTTFIKHTDKYRDNVFEGAVDGWYRSTASNLRIGVLLNYRIKKFDIHVEGGISRTGTFQSYLFVPTIYGLVGVDFRF